jgi:hypothetical protein
MKMKNELWQKCMSMVNERINNLREAMEEAQKSANEYGPPKDRYDSFRTQLLRKRDMYGQQLSLATEQKKTLENIDLTKSFKKAGFGSLVLTDSQAIFIAVGLGKIILDGKTCYAVSPLVPIAQALSNKGEGEEFELNGKKSKILQVF